MCRMRGLTRRRRSRSTSVAAGCAGDQPDRRMGRMRKRCGDWRLGFLRFISGLGDFLWHFDLAVAGGADLHELLDILLLWSLQVVCGSTVMGDVQTDFLLEWVDAEHAEGVEHDEEWSHDGEDPCADPQDAADLAEEEVGISGFLAPRVEPSGVQGCVSGGTQLAFLSKETDSDHTPGSVGEVNWDGVDGVIDLHGDQELGESVVDPSTDHADDDGHSWCDDGASCGDGDESTQGSVHGHGEVVRGLAGLGLFNDGVGEHGSDATGGGSEGGGDGAEGGSGGGTWIVDGQGRTWVESVPSEPEDEGSEDLEGDAVGWELAWGLEWVSIFIVEASLAWSEDDGSNEGGGSSGHVDDTGSGEVNDTDVTEWVVAECSEESVSAPDGSDDDRVHESCEEDGVAEVGGHLASLGDGSGNDGGGGGGECELEEESDEITARVEIADEEVLGSNEVLVSAAVVVVSEGVADGVESESSTAGVQQVLQHDVLDILLADGSSTEHGESGLHQEDEGSCEEKEEGVDTIDEA
mmetsp:Transcript_18891/g.52509  ORF Transcript_18891/g.52509 Transcript_18891/m.52509 type:complete len:523 (+) Transcript_18891:49-1617(+)